MLADRQKPRRQPAGLKVPTVWPAECWLLARRGSPSFYVLVGGRALAKPHTPNLAPVNLLSSVKELVFLPAGPPTSLGFPQCCLSKPFCCTGNGKSSSSRPGYPALHFLNSLGGFFLPGQQGVSFLDSLKPGQARPLSFYWPRPALMMSPPIRGRHPWVSRDLRPGKEQMGSSPFPRGSKSPCPGCSPMHPPCPA